MCRISGYLFVFISIVLSFLASVVLLPPIFILGICPLTVRVHSKLVSWVHGLCITMNVAMLEMIMQIRVRVTGAAPEKYGRSLFIMNNRSSLDWMWFWLYAYHYHGVSKLKFLIRGSLKLVPGYGWIMQQAAYGGDGRIGFKYNFGTI